jgi:glycosyltransferase involved in cell wall biosynthesis
MKLSFIIPFHNEEKNSVPMLKRVEDFAKSQKWNYQIVAVDDKSIDTTGKLLDAYAKSHPHVKILHRKQDGLENGNTMGKSLVEGTRISQGDYIIWTMGDLADDTSTYADIVQELKSGSDMVFGSRYMPGGSRGNLDPFKAFFSSWGTMLAKLLFGVPVHDITNAFRGFKRNVFEKIKLDSPGFAISPEFAIKAHLKGFKLGEVPTIYTNRIEGVSSFKLFRMIRSYLGLYFKLIFNKANCK